MKDVAVNDASVLRFYIHGTITLFVPSSALLKRIFILPKDDSRPDDHSLRLDAADVRDAKRMRSANGAPHKTKDASGRTNGGTWNGFGSGNKSAGNLNGTGRVSASPSVGEAAVFGGVRLSVTKKEALRSKGMFKIAPQSKVCVMTPYLIALDKISHYISRRQ